METKRQGDTEIIRTTSEKEWLELRTHDITSTDVAALFGISPYLTEYELWHRKKSGLIVELEPSEQMRWGTRLQDAIAAGICQDNGWTYRRKDEYVRHIKLQMGSSFDFEIMDGGEMPLLEIKNVDSFAFKGGWLIEGQDVQAPPHIEIQVQYQLAVADRKLAYIGCLIGGNRVTLIKRERDEKVITAIETRIAKFWHDVTYDNEPKPDFVKDAEFIKKLYSFAAPGKVIVGTPKMASIVTEHQALGRVVKTAEEGRQALKALLLTLIGDAEKVQGEGFSISAGLVGPKHIEYDREGYRDFRIYQKKPKEAIV